MTKVKRHVRDDPQVRRAQILYEAIRIIGERGYYGFAVQNLAERCGLTTGGLLYHFKTKEELFLAVLGEYERRIEFALRPLIDSFPEQDLSNNTLSLTQGLSLLRAMIAHSAAQPELMRLFNVVQAEALNPSHPGYEHFCEYQARVMDGFALIVAAHTTEPVSTVRQISALIQGLQHQWLRADGAFDILAEWDRAIAKILPGETLRGKDND